VWLGGNWGVVVGVRGLGWQGWEVRGGDFWGFWWGLVCCGELLVAFVGLRGRCGGGWVQNCVGVLGVPVVICWVGDVGIRRVGGRRVALVFWMGMGRLALGFVWSAGGVMMFDGFQRRV